MTKEREMIDVCGEMLDETFVGIGRRASAVIKMGN